MGRFQNLVKPILISETSPAGPPTARHHARPVGETEAVQRDGQSPSQAHHEGAGAQETRWDTECITDSAAPQG